MALSALHIEAAESEWKLDGSREWFERARRVLAGGISSSARATSTGDRPHPIYIARGAGGRIWDVDGNEYIDYLMAYGSAALGHADPLLGEALGQQIALGTMFGTCNTIEVELAEEICRAVPCAERVRFANSGSEAVAAAVRAARGWTGRSKILKFEGQYHGWQDVLAVSNRPSAAECGSLESPLSAPHSLGIPEGVLQDVVIAPWNERAILSALFDKHDGELAAVVAEPIVANNACIMPEPGYLQWLREECTRRGIVLIFDEIVTGFRVARGGAQELFGVSPDLAVFSKAAGGLPLSFLAGRGDIMDIFAAGAVKHGGTYNGNPLCAAAALYAVRQLQKTEVRGKMAASGERIMESIRRAAIDSRVPCLVQGVGSMFQVVFGDFKTPPRHYRDMLRADMPRFSAFRQALLEAGVHINNSGLACWFVSAAHTAEDLERTTAAIDIAFQAMAK